MITVIKNIIGNKVLKNISDVKIAVYIKSGKYKDTYRILWPKDECILDKGIRYTAEYLE